MSSRPSLPGDRRVTIALCLIAACFIGACAGAATAKAAFYQMVLCAANNGSNGFQTATNTVSSNNPGGIFSIENYCGPAPFPAGNSAFIRIVENQAAGNAGHTAYGSASWTAPAPISIVAAGGYTRQPNAFNEGWRARFWAEDHGGGGPHNILMQGSGVSGGGIFWGTTSTFASHLWPHAGWGSYRRFVYEMTCVRAAGCDRANFNATDANTFILTLDDPSPAQVTLTNGGVMMAGQWVKGTHPATYSFSEHGSGIRFERLYVDGSERWGIDHIAAAQCNRDSWGGVGEFARVFGPCPNTAGTGRSHALNTATLPDGAHTLRVCAQDYAQWQGIAGTGSQSCAERLIRTDNNAPGAPTNLAVTSANPERYLSSFGAQFNLPPNNGSPIAKVHHNVVNAAGEVVRSAQTLTATNPTALAEIEGPAAPGPYRLRVWLEDEVGNVGPAATAEIPRDTTPPAAPQALQVASPAASRSAEGFDLRWRNIPDAGSPIDAAHYEVRTPAGVVVVPRRSVMGANPQSIAAIETPHQRGDFELRLWLSDAEGNVGAPTSAPLAYECVRSSVTGAQTLSAAIDGEAQRILAQGEGATLHGQLRGAEGALSGAPICVFSRVEGAAEREFLGLALSGPGGGYRFALPAGPSRQITAAYRPGQRQLSAGASLRTQVKPTLRAHRQVIRTGGLARLVGEIPGPRNDDVVIVLQVKQGKGWLAFRRYRTRDGGRFFADYLFRRTSRPTTYEMRAQVRETGGYPYLQGTSDPIYLRVLPAAPRALAARCAKGRSPRVVRRAGRAQRRCVRIKRHAAKRAPRRDGARARR